MANYLTYPSKVMNITQNYSQSYSHTPHSTGTPKDYPIDEACADSGRSYFYCPCDEMKIAHIYGVGNGGTNTIWLESTSKVNLANGKSDYITILITHPNDDTLKNLYVGQKFKRGAAMFLEGNDGRATGWHFHIAVGTGKFTGTGWVQNSNGSWVLKTTGSPLKPEEAFYIDSSFTTKIINKNGINFKTLGKTAAASTPTTPAKTPTTTSTTSSFLPSKKYFGLGDTSPKVKKIAEFMRRVFPAYTNAKAVSETFNSYLVSSIKTFQKATKLEADGNVGPLTLA